MKMTTLIAAFLFGCFLCHYPAQALETSIAYQGVLRDSGGNVLAEKTQTLDFRLYTQPTGGTALWGRKITVQLSDEGLFNTELSGTSGSFIEETTHENLEDALKDARTGTALFVGLTVQASSGEIAPRQKLLMVPYASYAADTDRASGGFTVAGKATMESAQVTGALTVDGRTTLNGDITAVGALTAKDITAQGTGKFVGYGTIPVGGIIMWSGANVPDGWALCDGNTVNGTQTPNLVNRFIRGGVASGAVRTGGRASVTLTTDNLPAHEHHYAGDDELENIDSTCTTKVRITDLQKHYDASSKKDTKYDSKVYKTSTTGGNAAFDITPPYYQLAFIMRVK